MNVDLDGLEALAKEFVGNGEGRAPAADADTVLELVAMARNAMGWQRTAYQAAGPLTQQLLTRAEKAEALCDELAVALRWAQQEISDLSKLGTGEAESYVPDHDCWFDSQPDRGECPFHAHWFGGQVALAAYDTARKVKKNSSKSHPSHRWGAGPYCAACSAHVSDAAGLTVCKKGGGRTWGDWDTDAWWIDTYTCPTCGFLFATPSREKRDPIICPAGCGYKEGFDASH